MAYGIKACSCDPLILPRRIPAINLPQVVWGIQMEQPYTEKNTNQNIFQTLPTFMSKTWFLFGKFQHYIFLPTLSAIIKIKWYLKVHSPIFQNLVFGFIWRLLLQRYQFKIVEANLYTAVVYILLCKLSYSYHYQAHFFQMEHFSAVKFAVGYEKNMNFLVMPKSSKVWKKKKVEKIGLGSCKMINPMRIVVWLVQRKPSSLIEPMRYNVTSTMIQDELEINLANQTNVFRSKPTLRVEPPPFSWVLTLVCSEKRKSGWQDLFLNSCYTNPDEWEYSLSMIQDVSISK